MEDILNTLKIEIYTFNRDKLDKRWSYRNLNDFFARIYYTKNGEGYIIHHDKKFKLTPGKLFLIPPYSNMKAYCPDKMTQYWIHFNARVLMGVNLFDILIPSYEVKLEDEKYIVKQLKRLLDVYNSQEMIRK